MDGKSEVYAEFRAGAGVNLTEEDKQPITGFTWNDWKQYQDGGGWWPYDGELWLYYTRNSYTISFENCTGVADANLKYEAKLTNAKPQGVPGRPANVESDYEFIGWALDPAGKTMVDWEDTMPAHNLQVYAVWQKPSYTVSFVTNCDENVTAQTILKGEKVKMPDTTDWNTGEGYTFVGWYTDENFRTPFVAEQQIVSDMTLYAKWSFSGQCTYTIEAQDTEGKPIGEGTYEGGTVASGEYVTVNAPSVDGYTPNEPSKSVKIESDNQVIVFVYTKAPAWTATATYVDANGEPLQGVDTQVQENLTTGSWVFYAQTVTGYRARTQAQTATRDNPNVVFVYDKIPNPTYTVRFVDLQQQPIGVEDVQFNNVEQGKLVSLTPAELD